MPLRIYTQQEDITKSKVSVIVNSAHETLMGRGGVSGAILRTMTPDALLDLAAMGPVEYGTVVRTQGKGAGAKVWATEIFHAVANPRFEPMQLAQLYLEIFRKFREFRLENSDRYFNSIALVPVGMGIFGYPKEAVGVLFETLDFIDRHTEDVLQVVVTTLDDKVFELVKSYHSKT